MPVMRTIAVVLLLVGLAVLGYGIWNYFQPAHKIELGEAKTVASDAADDARNAVEDADISPAIWIGGAIVVIAGIAVFASRGNRNRNA